jgi:diacylglycerol kinase family enzyme
MLAETLRRMAPFDSSSMPLMIVMNAASGSRDGEAARAVIADALDAAGREYAFFTIDDPGRIAQIADNAAMRAQCRHGALVAVGGDGTLNAVAAAAIQYDLPMGVLPQGTFNFFGRTHGIPADIAEAVDALLHARIRPAQVGQVNGHVFLVNASVGLYPQVLEDREGWKRRFGRHRLVAMGAGLVTLLREYRSLQLEVSDGHGSRVVRTPTLVVANNALQLEKLGIAEAKIVGSNHGQLAGIGLKPIGKTTMLGLMLSGMLGRLGNAEQVVSFPFRQLVVRTQQAPSRAKVAIDGEILMLDYPLRFETTRYPLRLLVGAERVPGEDPG